jgi:hypothetical protein
MQQALDIFESYCEIWRLQVNVAKTKVMIFRKRKTAQQIISVVKSSTTMFEKNAVSVCFCSRFNCFGGGGGGIL